MAEVVDAVEQVVPVLAEKLGIFVTLLKAIGIALLVYIIYLVVIAFLNWKDRKRLKRVEKKVNEIDKKLDGFLGRKSKEESGKKQESKEKIKKPFKKK